MEEVSYMLKMIFRSFYEDSSIQAKRLTVKTFSHEILTEEEKGLKTPIF